MAPRTAEIRSAEAESRLSATHLRACRPPMKADYSQCFRLINSCLRSAVLDRAPFCGCGYVSNRAYRPQLVITRFCSEDECYKRPSTDCVWTVRSGGGL